MAIGTYEISHISTYGTYSSILTGYYNYTELIRIPGGGSNLPMNVKSFFYYGTSTADDLKFKIYDYSSNTQLYSQDFSSTNASGWQEFALTTPFTMFPGVEYQIGFYTSQNNRNFAYDADYNSGYIGGVSTPSGAIFDWYRDGLVSGSSSESNPNWSWWGGNLLIKLSLDFPPASAPTGVAVSNTPVPSEDSPVVNWTHNALGGTAQTKYQVRWRKT